MTLAQALWQSIDTEIAEADEQAVLRESVQRDKELSSGSVASRTHEEVMQAARRAIGCT